MRCSKTTIVSERSEGRRKLRCVLLVPDVGSEGRAAIFDIVSQRIEQNVGIAIGIADEDRVF